MKYLKEYKVFEFFGNKSGKIRDEFMSRHSDKFDLLKDAEGEELENLQKEIMDILKSEWQDLTKDLSGEDKNHFRKDIEIEIKG